MSHPAGPDRVSLSIKLFFGSGSISEGIKNTAFNTFLLFYYNQVLGLSGTLSGVALFLALCVDAITDPLVGSISDNHHGRFGRRHPFMYASAIPMAGCFYLLFNPPSDLSEMQLFTWLTAMAIGVRTSMTFYSIPSNSMVPELTPNYDERTGLVSFRLFFGWMGGLGMSILAYQVFFVALPGMTDGRLNAEGYRGFGLLAAALIAGSILTCALGTHRVIARLKPPPNPEPFTVARFSREVRDVLANRSYRVLIVAALFASVAGGFQDVVGLFMNTYFWGFSADQITILLLPLAVATLVAITLVRPITERYDKKSAALALATFAVLFGPLPVFLRLVGWMPQNGNPLLLYLIAGHTSIIVAAVVAIGVLVPSMIADTVDEGELSTGMRQEGLYSAAISFSAKAASGIGSLAAGIGLDLIQFPRNVAQISAVPEQKVFLLGLAVGPGMLVLYLLMLIFLARYPITRERHAEILAELEARHLEHPADH
jgi:Na+/melibiose symporter-like transporter